jgi:hypothetical protein
LEERALDETGTASLAGLELNTPTGLPQFLFTLNGATGKVGSVEVKLTWEGDYEASCVGEGTKVVVPKEEETTTTTTTTTTAPTPSPAPTPAPTPAPPAKGGVLAFGSAHLASSAHACVASSGYLASVTGNDITSVTFLLNGHKLKTLSKANSQGDFSLRVGVKTGKREHLSIHVEFSSATSNRSATITKTLARCAAVHHVTTPRFTG